METETAREGRTRTTRRGRRHERTVAACSGGAEDGGTAGWPWSRRQDQPGAASAGRGAGTDLGSPLARAGPARAPAVAARDAGTVRRGPAGSGGRTVVRPTGTATCRRAAPRGRLRPAGRRWLPTRDRRARSAWAGLPRPGWSRVARRTAGPVRGDGTVGAGISATAGEDAAGRIVGVLGSSRSTTGGSTWRGAATGAGPPQARCSPRGPEPQSAIRRVSARRRGRSGGRGAGSGVRQAAYSPCGPAPQRAARRARSRSPVIGTALGLRHDGDRGRARSGQRDAPGAGRGRRQHRPQRDGAGGGAEGGGVAPGGSAAPRARVRASERSPRCCSSRLQVVVRDRGRCRGQGEN